MKKYLSAKKALSFAILTIAFSFFFVLPALAQSGNAVIATSSKKCDPSSQLCNPLGTTSVQGMIGRVINGVMGIVGSLALLMFVYGGLLWMTSGGAPDKVKKGKEIILWSSLGMVVIFGAYALAKFIINALTTSGTVNNV